MRNKLFAILLLSNKFRLVWRVGDSVSRKFMKIKGIHFLTRLNYSQWQDAVLAKTGYVLRFVWSFSRKKKFTRSTVLFILNFWRLAIFQFITMHYKRVLCDGTNLLHLQCRALVMPWMLCRTSCWPCYEYWSSVGEFTFPFRCAGMGVASVHNFFPTIPQRSGVFAKWLGVMCRYLL